MKYDFNSLFAKAGWNTYFEYGWQEVFEIFKHMNHTEAYELKQQKPDSARLKELLVGRFEFSEASVSRRLQACLATDRRFGFSWAHLSSLKSDIVMLVQL